MDIKGLNVGQILVSKVPTSAGLYNSFWIVSEKTARTASVQRLRVDSFKQSDIATKVVPTLHTSGSASFKLGSDAGGIYLGGSGKKDLNKTYITEEFDDQAEYVNVFDASRLK